MRNDLAMSLLSNSRTGSGRLIALVKAVVAVLAAILLIATVCVSWPLVPRHMGARWSVNPEPLSLAAAGDECYRILLDGIRNTIQTETGSSNEFEARAKLMQVDDGYSYHDYQRDYSKAHAASSEMGVGGKVSLSYDVFSTSASGHYSTSGREMSKADFELKKKELLSQKHMLMQEHSAGGASSESVRVLSQTVSSQVVHAWEACQSFAQQNVKLTQTVNPNGDSVEVSLKYVLGDRPQGSTQTMLTEVEPSPKDKALCSIIDDEGRTGRLPIELIPGMVAHVACHRQKDYTGRLAVTLGTNLEMHTVTVDFADVVPLKLAEKLQEEMASLGKQVYGVQGEISDMKNSTRHQGSVVRGEFAATRNQIHGMQVKMTAMKQAMNSRVDVEQDKISDIKYRMHHLFPDGACRPCPYSCAGSYYIESYQLGDENGFAFYFDACRGIDYDDSPLTVYEWHLCCAEGEVSS